MSQNLGPFTPKKYSTKLVEILWNETVYKWICNTDYEGEIKKAGDRVVVRTAAKIVLSAYTKNMTLSLQDLNPTSEELIIDQQYYFAFGVDDVDKIQNDVNAIETYAQGSKNDMSELIDTDVLGLWKQVHGDNAIGTNYSTGTVTVTTGTGAVTGSSTVFTADMVGAPFKAVGHTKYYRVKTFTSATAIVIEDMDGSGYTGGAIGGGTAYEIKAASGLSVTKSTVYGYLVDLKTKLSKKLTPRKGRWIVVNAETEGLILKAPEFIPAVGDAYTDAVKGGLLGRIAGFDVYFSELVDGDATTGYYIMCGDKQFIAFAMQIMEVYVVPHTSVPNSFVNTCKGLLTWGRRVFEGNRGRGAYIRLIPA